MSKKVQKAHEIFTVYALDGVSNKLMDRYIVVASSTPKAVSLLSLREGEQILRAEELKHKVIVEGRK